MDYAEPGSVLPNGATVVASRPVGNPANGEAIILALTPPLQSAHPYVTWRLDAMNGNTYSGDYCATFEGAIRSYAARSGFAVETLGEGMVPAEDLAKDVTPRRTDGTLTAPTRAGWCEFHNRMACPLHDAYEAEAPSRQGW